MVKKYKFKVTANHNIGGKSETERYEDGILTKIVAGVGRRIENTKLHSHTDGTFVRMIGGKVQNKSFEVIKTFSDVSLLDVTPKKYRQKEKIEEKQVSVVIIRFPNSKVIDKGESVCIPFECSPSAARISDAFREQLGKTLKSNVSVDFFTIQRV
jgi:hypothetical protein